MPQEFKQGGRVVPRGVVEFHKRARLSLLRRPELQICRPQDTRIPVIAPLLDLFHRIAKLPDFRTIPWQIIRNDQLREGLTGRNGNLSMKPLSDRIQTFEQALAGGLDVAGLAAALSSLEVRRV